MLLEQLKQSVTKLNIAVCAYRAQISIIIYWQWVLKLFLAGAGKVLVAGSQEKTAISSIVKYVRKLKRLME